MGGRSGFSILLGLGLGLVSCGGGDGAGDSNATGGTASGGAPAGGTGGTGSSPSGGAGGSGGTATGGAGGAATGGVAGSAGGASGGNAGTGAWVDPIAGVGQVAKVAGGFSFTEGPAWFSAHGKLLFSDIPANRIYALTPPSNVTVHREPSGNSNGLAVDPAGLLVAAEHSGRRISRTAANGGVTTVADAWQGKKLNSPNDVIARSDGTLYFTDPPYGGNPNELGFQGVFRVSPAGALSLVTQDMFRPNGIALSPDEKTLYVCDSEQNFVRKYDLAADGTASNPQKFADTAPTPDGMAVDLQGDLFVTTQAGVVVYRSDATLVGTIAVPEQPANATFGGSDGKSLYITARTSLYRVDVAVAGLP